MDLLDPVQYGTPERGDGTGMWKIVTDGTLDDNSPYCYMMMAHYFKDTCIVAKDKATGNMLGFIIGFRPPKDQESLFIWQMGTAEAARGKGVASRLLLELAAANSDISYIKATVTPTNEASMNTFKSLAAKLNCNLNVNRNLFRVTDFPVDSGHMAEDEVVVGPIKHARLQHAAALLQEKQVAAAKSA
ncbi:ectA [Symbiodinium sp. KB8]|nr:ectA [Symbiodinium sp. KB8]